MTDPADFAGSLRLVADGGTALDPQVVSVLQRRYSDLERMAWGEVTNSTESPETPGSELGKLSDSLNAESKPATNSILDPIVSARVGPEHARSAPTWTAFRRAEAIGYT